MSTPHSDGDEPDAKGQIDDDGSGGGAVAAESDASDSLDASDGDTGGVENTVPDSDTREASERLTNTVNALRAENDALSADYARARKASHRRTAVALAAIGVVAALGGVAFPRVRAVLFVTGAIGLFGGVLTWSITPERVVPVDVSESVYDATATTLTGVRDELGLQPQSVYVPVDDRVRGFIPRHGAFALPESPRHVFVTDAGVSRGVSFSPTGLGLTTETERIRRTRPPTDAATAIEQTGATLVEHFEVADDVAVEEAPETSRLTVSVREPAFGPVTRVDHPVVSALACGVVRATDEPIAVEPIDDRTVAFETDPGTDAGAS